MTAGAQVVVPLQQPLSLSDEAQRRTPAGETQPRTVSGDAQPRIVAGDAPPTVAGEAQPAAPDDTQPPVEDPLAPEAVRPPVAMKPVPRRLDLNMSVFEGYDLMSFTAGLPGLQNDPHLTQDVAFSGVSTSMVYSQLGDNATFGALAAADLRYYSLLPTLLPVNFYGGVNFSTRLGRRLQFSGSQTGGYSPFYSFGDFLNPSDPGALRTPGADQNIARLRTYTSNSTAALSWRLGRKATLTGRYSFDYIGTPSNFYRVASHGASATLSYRATKYLTTRVGYGYYRSLLGAQALPSYNVHSIDAGLGYARPLSFSRRTLFAANTGMALLTSGPTRFFTVTGDTSLSYMLSRTWSTSVGYSRSVGTVGGLLTPFVNDVAFANVGGLVTRHLTFNVSGSYARGGAAIGPSNGYDAVSATSRIGYTLTRYMPIYVEYVYYFYQFQQSLGLAPGFPIYVQRHGIRSGLSYSLPLIGRRPGQR